MPGRIANPVWVDDEAFDMSYHVRRAGLPRPGSDQQLQDFVARVQPRKLDRTRPLWEVYLVEGLHDGRFAIVTKTHYSLIDGVNALDIAHVIVDAVKGEGEGAEPVPWEPSRRAELGRARHRAPSSTRCAAPPRSSTSCAAASTTCSTSACAPPSPRARCSRRSLARRRGRHPTRRSTPRSARHAAGSWSRPTSTTTARCGGGWRAAPTPRTSRSTTSCSPPSPAACARGCSGAARRSARPRVVRAMVPVSIYGDDPAGMYANQVMACVVNLPVGEPGASMRLHQIAFAMRQQMEGGQAVGASSLANLAGFAPPTLHALGARLGSAMSRRLYNVMITNVPGPQSPLYAGDAKMLSTYPVMPLAKGQALSIGITSYDGGVYYGLNADRDAMPDVDDLGSSILESIDELTSGRES